VEPTQVHWIAGLGHTQMTQQLDQVRSARSRPHDAANPRGGAGTGSPAARRVGRALAVLFIKTPVRAARAPASRASGWQTVHRRPATNLAPTLDLVRLDGVLLRIAGSGRGSAALPMYPPVVLTGGFGENDSKSRQSLALLRKGRIDAGALCETITLLHTLLWPANQMAVSTNHANPMWQALRLRPA
jgi:hypothetical protein